MRTQLWALCGLAIAACAPATNDICTDERGELCALADSDAGRRSDASNPDAGGSLLGSLETSGCSVRGWACERDELAALNVLFLGEDGEPLSNDVGHASVSAGAENGPTGDCAGTAHGFQWQAPTGYEGQIQAFAFSVDGTRSAPLGTVSVACEAQATEYTIDDCPHGFLDRPMPNPPGPPGSFGFDFRPIGDGEVHRYCFRVGEVQHSFRVAIADRSDHAAQCLDVTFRIYPPRGSDVPIKEATDGQADYAFHYFKVADETPSGVWIAEVVDDPGNPLCGQRYLINHNAPQP